MSCVRRKLCGLQKFVCSRLARQCWFFLRNLYGSSSSLLFGLIHGAVFGFVLILISFIVLLLFQRLIFAFEPARARVRTQLYRTSRRS